MTEQFSDENLFCLSEQQARELYAQGQEAVVWALLKLSALARQKADPKPDPATPSAMIAPYNKPAPKGRRKKPGRKKGHPGARRPAPPHIDIRQEHRLECCPDCDGPLAPSKQSRTRIVEDLEQARATITEHQIHSSYCPRCKKRVEPKVTQALPRATVGNRALALSSWLHYGLGNSLSQVTSVFDSLFHFPVSGSGLVQMWGRLADALNPWYEQLAAEASGSAVLHADETGWRVNGKTHWLWCFTNPTLTCYLIDPSRGSKVVTEFLGECFEGMLISDFFAAYNVVAHEQRQVCLAHLLREIKKVSARDQSPAWRAFAKKLKRLLRDALRLAAHPDRSALKFLMLRYRLQCRITKMCNAEHEHPDCRRLTKRLIRHRDSLLEFLYNPDVPPDNNRAEREIRPAVIARKNSFHNMSDRGARTQSILMSVYRTLKLRGYDPLETIADALALQIATGQLPGLPPVRAADP
jgi:transposase